MSERNTANWNFIQLLPAQPGWKAVYAKAGKDGSEFSMVRETGLPGRVATGISSRVSAGCNFIFQRRESADIDAGRRS